MTTRETILKNIRHIIEISHEDSWERDKYPSDPSRWRKGLAILRGREVLIQSSDVPFFSLGTQVVVEPDFVAFGRKLLGCDGWVGGDRDGGHGGAVGGLKNVKCLRW